MLTLVLAQAAAALVVILIVSVAAPCFRGTVGVLGVLGIGYGLSVGLTSCVFFIWLAFLRRVLPDYRTFESIVLSALAAASILPFVAKRRRASLAAVPFAFGRRDAWPAAGALAAVAAFLFASAFFYRIAPHGIEDAISIWNLRARFLFRGGDQWTDGLLPVNWHGDYPLLLPCEVARCWTWAGSELTLVPALLGLSFTLATAAVLVGGLGLVRGATSGLLAGATLLAHGYYFETSASQLADIPLAFCVLASVVLLTLGDRQGPSDGRILYGIAGFCLGLAAWTKNEGLVFLLALPVSRLIFRKGAGPWWRSLGELIAIALGALPVVVVVYMFKARFAPPNDLLEAAHTAKILARISDPSRYLAILKSVLEGLGKIGPGLIPALAVYAWLLGRSPDHNFRWRPVLATGLIVFACYLAAYLISPHPLAWHLESSLDRLLLHFWPTALFGFFACVNSPDEASPRDTVQEKT